MFFQSQTKQNSEKKTKKKVKVKLISTEKQVNKQ